MKTYCIRLTAIAISCFAILQSKPAYALTTTSVDNLALTVYYTDSGGGGGSPVPALSFTSGGIALAGFLWSRRRSRQRL